MRDLVLFPHMISPIFVGRDKTRCAAELAIAGDGHVLVVAQRRGTDNDPHAVDAIYPVGVIARVIDRQTQVDGVLKVSVCGLRRAAIARLVIDDFLGGQVVSIEEGRGDSDEAGALSHAVLDAYQIYASVDFSSLPPGPKARFSLPSVGNPSLLADTLAPLLPIGIEEKQKLLEASDVVTRLEMILGILEAGRPTK
jgi:ATP-dependent Lon protease